MSPQYFLCSQAARKSIRSERRFKSRKNSPSARATGPDQGRECIPSHRATTVAAAQGGKKPRHEELPPSRDAKAKLALILHLSVYREDELSVSQQSRAFSASTQIVLWQTKHDCKVNQQLL